MKKTLSFLSLAIILLSVAGCQWSPNSIHHLWFYTYSESPSGDSLLAPASFLECHKDGSYTRDFGHFEYGAWRLEDHHLYLTNHQGHTAVYAVDLSRPKEMQLTMKEGYKASFERQPLPDPKEDPFSLENNRWRIRPAQKETGTEIRRRLYEHCRFWETPAIDVRSTPTNIKIYGNGFTLKEVQDLPAAWKSCFYDEEDCTKANDMIKDIFRTRNIAWPLSDNRYKQFIGAFQQMETFLK